MASAAAAAAAVAVVIKSDEKSASMSKTESDEKMMIIGSVSSSSSLAIEKMMIIDSVSSSSLAAAEKAKTERSKIESGCRRSWSDLPTDMVEVILCELPSLRDRIRARAVCKNWLLLLNEINPRPSSLDIPIVMSFKWDNTIDIESNLSQCKLFDPMCIDWEPRKLKLDSICNPPERTREEIYKTQFSTTKVCASKNGWVMFYHVSSQIRENPAPAILEPKFVQKTSFFLYNPFTKHTITLPDLITPGLTEFNPSFDIATFSSSPEEDDCVFFVVRVDHFRQGPTFIATYSRSIMEQQQKWKIDHFQEENIIRFDEIIGSVYIDGIFYCLSYHGILKSFNVALHEWTNLTTLCLKPIDIIGCSVYIFESNGELFLVHEYTTIERLYVFDKSSNVWVRRKNRYLKDRVMALFLGSYGSFAVSVDGADDDQNDGADDDQNEIEEIVWHGDFGHTTSCHSFTSKSVNWENFIEFFDYQWSVRSTIIWIQPSIKF